MSEQSAESDGFLRRIRRSPWWFCTGWWSPWCLIDAAAHCKVPWICKKHDDAQVRWFEKRYPPEPFDPKFRITSATWPVTPSWTSSTNTTLGIPEDLGSNPPGQGES